MTFVLMLLLVVIATALYAIQWFALHAQLQAIRAGSAPQGAPPEEVLRRTLSGMRPDLAPEFAIGMSAAVGLIFTVIIAGSATGNEFGWATVRTILAHGGRRAAFLFAKLVALGLVALVFVAICFATAFVASFVVASLGGLDLTLSGDIAGRAGGYAARALYVIVPYLALAVMTAVFARSAAAGIAVTLVVFFGETIVSGLAVQLNRDLKQLFDAGLATNVQTIVRTPPASAPPGAVVRMPSGIDVGFAVLILAMYATAFVSLTVHRFAKRDLTLA